MGDSLDQAAPFVAQRGGKQQRGGLAGRFLGGIAEQTLGAGIPAGDGAVDRVADHRVAAIFDDGPELRLGQLRLLQIRTGLVQIELVDHRVGEVGQQFPLVGGEALARLLVDDAQCADIEIVAGPQRRAGIEADVRKARHQRIVDEARVLGRVVDHQHVVILDGVGAKGPVTRRLGGVDAMTRLEPLTSLVDQADQGDRHADHLGGDAGEAVERFFCLGIEDFETLQRV